MKSVISFIGIILFLSHFAWAIPKEGFVTWSEGDQMERTLKYRKITNGELGEPVTIVPKGADGGDIWGAISFDGKWLAWGRKNGSSCPKQGDQWNGNGEDDYHKFHCWSIYVGRLDGNLPLEPIKVIDEGYWPSWGDDSFGAEKTLYFGVWTKGEIWKTTISDVGNKFSEPVKHAEVPGWKEGDHHMQCAPNGKLVAIRYGRTVTVVGINGHSHNKGVGGGCHPSWFADSKHLYHAAGKVVDINGGKIGSAGKYHFGSSSNMKWAVTVTQFGGGNKQNNGWPIGLGPVEYNTADSAITKVGPYETNITDKGNFPDVHDWDGIEVNVNSKSPAPSNFNIELSGRQLIVNTTISGLHIIELYDVNGVRKLSRVSNSSSTEISVKDYPEGIYILRMNSAGKTSQKKLMIM